MALCAEMVDLHFLDDEELLQFFHCQKTEISCMDKPQIFLDKLKDYDLIPEDTYEVRHRGGHRVTQLLWRTPSGRI